MTRLAWAAVAAATLVAACDGPAPATASGASAWGGTPVSTDPPIPAADCRWEGYGIGSAGQSQCDTQHLLAHSAAQCSGAGGRVDRTRTVSAGCPADAMEVQSYCCYKDGLPAASDTPIAMTSGPMTGRLAPAPGEDATRPAVLARAAASCLVGDWNALYAPDGVTVQMLRFGCK